MYTIGDIVKFNCDVFDSYHVYLGTLILEGKIESYDKENNVYSINVNGIIYKVDSKNIILPTFEEKLNSILNTYRLESEIVMAEFLESEKVPKNTTIAEAFRLYVEAMKRVNGDEFYVIKEGIKEEI
jgi:hypothetical protein